MKMNNNSNVWGSLLQSKQPVWGSSNLRSLANNLNAKNVRGNLSKKALNSVLAQDGSFPEEDALFTERNIRWYGSDIYFFDSIDDETQLIFQQMVKRCIAQFLAEHIADILSGTLSETITIHLNSPGGYAYCGLALYDFIKTLSVPVTCVVEGTCASAATFILLACEERNMSDNSVFLMHQCSWGGYGDNRYMQDEAENCRKLMTRIRSIYMEETEIGKEYEDESAREAYIQSLLEHDRYFSKEECVQLGIIKDEEDMPTLSEDAMAQLNAFAQKLYEEENKTKKAEKKETSKVPVKKTKAPAKKAPVKKAPVKKPLVKPSKTDK